MRNYTNRVAAATAGLPALVIGAATRLTGFFRGAEPQWGVGEDSVHREAAFFHFHPDKDKVLDPALTLISPFVPSMTA